MYRLKKYETFKLGIYWTVSWNNDNKKWSYFKGGGKKARATDQPKKGLWERFLGEGSEGGKNCVKFCLIDLLRIMYLTL